MRRGFCVFAAVAVSMMGASVAASAMPVAAGPNAADTAVTLIADGCGPFGHRSHYGYCKQNGPDQGGGGYGGGYDRGAYGDGGGYGFRGGARVYDEGYEPEPRCFVRETYYGPRRICR